jgi:hypothetical protein
MTPEEAVRTFFDCYTNGRPEDFDECVAPDYVDYGLLRSTRHALIGDLPL